MYLYLVSLISLVMIIVAATMLINMALKTWVFKAADNYPIYPTPCVQDPNAPADTKAASCNPDQLNAQADYQQAANRSTKQREAAQSVALILVAAPVFVYHWRLARREA